VVTSTGTVEVTHEVTTSYELLTTGVDVTIVVSEVEVYVLVTTVVDTDVLVKGTYMVRVEVKVEAEVQTDVCVV